MTLDFLPEASAEFYEASEYYESKQEGLGWRFRSEVLEVCRLIVQQPLLWRERPGGYRRVNCPVFPYSLVIGQLCVRHLQEPFHDAILHSLWHRAPGCFHGHRLPCGGWNLRSVQVQ